MIVILYRKSFVLIKFLEWLERIETERARHQIFQVTRAYSELHTTFKENDIILEFDDNLVTEVRDLDIQYQNDEVRTMVVRDGGIVRLDVRTISAKYLETEDFVFCCGLILQRPHHAVRQQIADLLSDVYVSFVVRTLFPRLHVVHQEPAIADIILVGLWLSRCTCKNPCYRFHHSRQWRRYA